MGNVAPNHTERNRLAVEAARGREAIRKLRDMEEIYLIWEDPPYRRDSRMNLKGVAMNAKEADEVLARLRAIDDMNFTSKHRSGFYKEQAEVLKASKLDA